MRSPHETKAQGRVQQVTDFTMRLKPFAKELDIPMLALSQLNRAGERSDNKVPQLSDLRDSDSIEQDVDIILFLFREVYYLAKEEPPTTYEYTHKKWEERHNIVKDEGEVHLWKNRYGQTMKIPLLWMGSTMRYWELLSDEGDHHR